MIKKPLSVVAVMCVTEQDHEVQENKIMLVSLLMAELGVHSVAYAFPKVKIITTAVDKGLDDFLHVIPGIGKHFHASFHSFTYCLVNSDGLCSYLCTHFTWSIFFFYSLESAGENFWIIADV